MERIIRILVTGAGSPGIVGTIYSLRNNSGGVKVNIITCDVQADAVGKYLSDNFYLVPPGENRQFINSILEISKKEKIDVILPQVTKELLPLAESKPLFESKGIKIAISSKNSIEIANDKWNVTIAAIESGVPVPISILAKNENEFIKAVRALGYPEKKVVVKPRMSNGLRGLRILSEETWNVERFLSQKPESIEISLQTLLDILHKGNWPELIVQEYLPGDEYTIDVFRGSNNVIAIPRIREKIRSGITFSAKIELRKDLELYAIDLAKRLDLKYAFGFQFKLSNNGIPKLLECNPRVQGTMVASTFAGVNIIWWSIKEALGEKIEFGETNRCNNGMRFLRYWGGIAVDSNNKKVGTI